MQLIQLSKAPNKKRPPFVNKKNYKYNIYLYILITKKNTFIGK